MGVGVGGWCFYYEVLGWCMPFAQHVDLILAVDYAPRGDRAAVLVLAARDGIAAARDFLVLVEGVVGRCS